MKTYLSTIKSTHGTIANIAYYADTPNKNYRIYYCGSDIGERFEYLGNAARYLEQMADNWQKFNHVIIFKTYTTKNEIPRRGSNA